LQIFTLLKAPLLRRRGENFSSVSGREIGEFEPSVFPSFQSGNPHPFEKKGETFKLKIPSQFCIVEKLR